MARFYLPAEEWEQGISTLRGSEARHAVKVLRLKEGDQCVLFDGRGRRAEASIQVIRSPDEIVLSMKEILSQNRDLPRLTLCQAIPKGGNMDLIIQKAVELGVSEIIPLVTERTIVRLHQDEDAAAKQHKWQKTALAACKQCGQDVLPQVRKPVSFAEWVTTYKPEGLGIIASLTDSALPVRDVLENARAAQCREASVLIGPEGDFTAEETEKSVAAGFVPVSLGSIVLRVETATFFALSALRYTLD